MVGFDINENDGEVTYFNGAISCLHLEKLSAAV